MGVLRWIFFFVLALFLVIYAIFWLVGRPVTLPSFGSSLTTAAASCS